MRRRVRKLDDCPPACATSIQTDNQHNTTSSNKPWNLRNWTAGVLKKRLLNATENCQDGRCAGKAGPGDRCSSSSGAQASPCKAVTPGSLIASSRARGRQTPPSLHSARLGAVKLRPQPQPPSQVIQIEPQAPVGQKHNRMPDPVAESQQQGGAFDK